MEIKQTTTFAFSFTHEGLGYNFSVPAATQSEACEKLHRALSQIVGELKDSLKTKPN